MKRHWKPIVVTAIALVLVFAVSGVVLAAGGWRGGANPPATTTPTSISAPAPAGTTDLSDTEEQALLFMREEEKLARDVYTKLYSIWNVRVFSNIAASESRHMESVKTLLDTYGLTDPVAVDTPGVFVNPELQAAYDQLIAQGSQSLTEAYKVGVAIENLDIDDLEDLLGISAHADITQVATNLLKGSQNHLAAFTR